MQFLGLLHFILFPCKSGESFFIGDKDGKLFPYFRRKYKREMNLIQERVDYLKKIDSETLDKGFAKTLKV